MIWARRKQEGFALPTILIAGVVMLMVLVTAVTATESVNSALDRQYYDQLAREAAESGIAFAQYCLESNGYTPSWTSSYPLRPDKDCTGVNNNGASEWIVNQGNIQTTFSVPAPTNQNVTQLVVATGTVQRLRPSTGQPWRTYTYSSSAQIGVNLDLNTVAFGYVGGSGAYFATIAADGTLRAVGYNGQGQLGNGTTTNTLTPTTYLLNGTDKPASVYTNFLSGGLNTFVVTDKGTVYGAGDNAHGQLGDGTTTNRSQAVQFNLPAAAIGKSVAVGGYDTFILTTNNNIYTTGMCANGLLGYNYTISGCTDQPLYKRVSLPTPTSDPNTQPTTNITTDNHTVYVRMQGGKVYGWGGNFAGQLANNSTADVSNPIQIGTFGNVGQPQATQVFTDGSSVWIVDSAGNVWGAGKNQYGQLGGKNISIYNPQAGNCLDNKSADGVTLQLA